MTAKLKKLLNNPGIFFRDYFNKKYPILNSELKVSEDEETSIYFVDQLAGRIEEKFNSNLIVDVVYTWVNNQDSEWLLKKKAHSEIDNIICESVINEARYENHNELFYSIKSVKKYLPWVRNIYIVTDNQIPEWYEFGDNVFIVDHREIINHEFLPTFNSHVIEANLHKIKNLSENFIYFNDDVMVAKPLSKDHFFKSNGLASIFVSNKEINKMLKSKITPTLQASVNCNQLLLSKYNEFINFPLVHTYVPLKKSTYENVWFEYGNIINDFLKNKYRSSNDLNIATFLIPWVMYMEGNAIVSNDICYYFNIRSPHASTQYKKLLSFKDTIKCPHSFCVNDFKKSALDVKDFDSNLEEFLKNYFFDL